MLSCANGQDRDESKEKSGQEVLNEKEKRKREKEERRRLKKEARARKKAEGGKDDSRRNEKKDRTRKTSGPTDVNAKGQPGRQVYTPSPNSPLARKEHPRLFFTAQSFKEVYGPYISGNERLDFQKYVNRVDKEYDANHVKKDRSHLLFDACNYAFLYYASQQPDFSDFLFRKTPEEYAAKAYEHVVEINSRVRVNGMREFRSSLTGFDGGYITMSLAVVYDWCNPWLDMAQKRYIADLFIHLKNSETTSNCYQGDKFNYGNDWNSQCWEVGFFGGLAMYGDDLGGNYTAEIQEMLNSVQWFVMDQVFEIQDHQYEGAAGNGEGTNYHNVTMLHQTFQAAGVGPAIGVNLFTKYGSLYDTPLSQWFQVQPRYWNDGRTRGWTKHRFDDVWLSTWEPMGAYMAFVPFIHNIKKEMPEKAGSFAWLLQKSRYGVKGDPIKDDGDILVHWLWYKFLWGIRDVEPLSIEEKPIPESHRFAMGEVIMQSDLTTQDATKVLFYTPRWITPIHDHIDDGGFEIFKNGLLAINTGGNWKASSPLGVLVPKSTKPHSPVFHNVMALYKDNLQYEKNRGANTKADYFGHPDNQPGGANEIGRVAAMRFEKGMFDYIDYDYTLSFKGDGDVDQIRRTLLYLRDPAAPDYNNQEEYVIVYDHVMADPGYKRRFLLKTAYLPEIVDGQWQEQDPFHLTNSGASQLKISNTYGNWDARMFLQVVYPQQFDLTVRGGQVGSGRRWFVDAEGNSLHKGGVYVEAARAWIGAYRLEIEDKGSGQESRFVTAMQIGSASTLNQMVSTAAIETATHMGTVLNNNRVTLFNKTGDAQRKIDYTAKLGGMALHVIGGMAPGGYQLSVDGQNVSQVRVAEDGIAFFRHQGGSSFRLTAK